MQTSCDPVYKQTSNLRKAKIKIQFMKVGQLKNDHVKNISKNPIFNQT